MDEQGIALQLLSMPGALDAEQARKWNDRTADIVAAHPDRFGLLAALPMAEPDRAVDEIRYATDQLHADGFAVATNYDGVYFGDGRFEAVFAKLDQHQLPLFVHPALPPAFDQLGLGRPGPLIEYPMDMARTIVDAIFAGVLLRYRNLRLVLAHAGGVLPTLQDRIALLGRESWVANPLQLASEQLTEQLGGLYLDTAIGGGAAGIVPAVQMVGVDHLVFGTDYPPRGHRHRRRHVKEPPDHPRPCRAAATGGHLRPPVPERGRTRRRTRHAQHGRWVPLMSDETFSPLTGYRVT
ncbi:amidohydrolase family protein [Actinoallomurus sp. NBC_01490]|uniref:amidohydrolase family protein n=1 Tax=Actinoallomurus sp. NBC_01490 TaxID=2903557 RepID=UPI002E366ACC|nr:amidohydrolase family protein [Actinoallomurus sp. NBC_01490]